MTSTTIYPFANFCGNISNITKPLSRYLEIGFFNFVRIYNDKKRISLSNHEEWSADYYKNKHYITPLVSKYPREIINQTSYIHLWHDFEHSAVLNSLQGICNIRSGITIVKPFDQYIDYYYFGSNQDWKNSYNVFSNMHALNRFIRYFQKEASQIIIEAAKTKLFLPENVTFKNDDNLKNKLEEEFLKATNIMDYLSKKNDSIRNCSKREIQCFELMLKGFSSKSGAEKLYISPRTFETHINNLKTKLNCKNKIELIMKMLDLGFIEIICGDKR